MNINENSLGNRNEKIFRNQKIFSVGHFFVFLNNQLITNFARTLFNTY
jgi:hypothetical protein